jgi:hypothetical protein
MLPQPWRLRQQVLNKLRYSPTKLHGFTTYKNIILTLTGVKIQLTKVKIFKKIFTLRFWSVLTMVCDNLDYWIIGYRPVFEIALKRTGFRKLDLFPFSCDGMGHTYSVERANLNQWTRSSDYCSLKSRTMDKVQNPSNPRRIICVLTMSNMPWASLDSNSDRLVKDLVLAARSVILSFIFSFAF